MARLVPNPLGDLTQPLKRVESAIGELGEDLQDIHALPGISKQLTELNRGVTAVLEALEDIQHELHALNRPSANGSKRT